MAEVPKDLKYSKEHEWVRVAGDAVVIGITDHAQEQLGDVVYVDLPSVGSEISQFESFGTVESVKAASDLYAPVSGKVVEVNDALKEHPELVNESPYDKAWMIKVKLKDKKELDVLLSPADYDELVASIS
ncbi:MAG: glycine cleavage system protein GcvH [Chloroflexi bacterium]|nr:glycine cleavage system protein GcvH [Chloroflexota bacterium]MDA8188142.1 glycine cleavage system protein GcvH [Dehalococcoidales bacterium]